MVRFILTFDIARELLRERKRINRDLHRMKAEKFQHSLWKSNDLQSLIEIALFINKNGGNASILEEKFIF